VLLPLLPANLIPICSLLWLLVRYFVLTASQFLMRRTPIGDYITYSATQVESGADPLFAIYTLEANLGIYTAPGTK
jgi:hypothetical protein